MESRRLLPILSLLLAAFVLLDALCATASAQSPPNRLAARPGSTLARIRQQGVLRWGADPSGGAPFVFFDPKNPDKIIGFEVDIMDRLAHHMGVRPQLVRSDWAALIDNLRSKRTDLVLNGLEVTPKREAEVYFSVPYYRYQQQLTVRAPDRERYTDLDSLKGKKIAVLDGSASVEVLKGAGWADDLILRYDDSLKPYTEVKLRRADAALADWPIAAYYAGKDTALFNVPKTFSPGVYAAAIRKDDDDLLVEVNRALDLMKRDGELGEIYQKWDIWTPEQKALGIVEGKQVAVTSEAQGNAGSSQIDWGRTLIALRDASGYTLALTTLAMPAALVMGLILALLGRSPNVLLSWPARAYIQVVRGTPLLVQIYLIYYSLPQLGELLGLGGWLTWNNFVVGAVCLAANYAAYEAEIHRAGLDAVPKGQREAALSLGMSERQSFFYVILPQSFRIILPPVLNDLISMLKDSCLVSVIGVQELLTVAMGIGKANFNMPVMLVLAAIIYLIMSWVADWLGKRLEARLKGRGRLVVSASHTPRH